MVACRRDSLLTGKAYLVDTTGKPQVFQFLDLDERQMQLVERFMAGLGSLK